MAEEALPPSQRLDIEVVLTGKVGSFQLRLVPQLDETSPLVSAASWSGPGLLRVVLTRSSCTPQPGLPIRTVSGGYRPPESGK